MLGVSMDRRVNALGGGRIRMDSSKAPSLTDEAEPSDDERRRTKRERRSTPNTEPDPFPVGLLFVTGCSAVALAGYAYISQVRVGFTHLPLWVYLLALGATALIGGVATTLVGDPLSDLPRAGERLGDHLIVVPVSEWDT